jgi:subtilisin family serine protease
MAKITINGVSVDPMVQGPALAAANLIARDASGSNYVLIQTRHPLSKAEKAELAGLGVVVLEYVPENTYLCQYQPTNLEAIRTLPYVDWANTYMRGFKVAPSLSTDVPADDRGVRDLVLADAPVVDFSTDPKTVDIVFHKGVAPDAVRERVAAAARADAQDVAVSGQKIRLTVQRQYLRDIAAIDEVRHIEEARPYKLHNDIARQIMRVPTANGSAPLLEGEDQVVAVADTGFDLGSTTNVHPAFGSRVAKLYALGRASNANDPDGHGTHVAGSVLGDGTSSTLGISIRGTAPRATLVLQSVLDAFGGLGGLPDDLHDLFGVPYSDDGARVHTNSWGSIVGDGTYNSNSAELDDFVWNNRDGVICFSAGNEATDRNADGQIDAMSVTPPGTAKNCITVGATENDRPGFVATYSDAWPSDFPADPIASDRLANAPEGMVAFSGRGPTRNQRIKPDVVAPGTFILSSRSRAASGNGWAPSADPLYFFLGGTSMATPLVAGCAALVRQFLIGHHDLATPSAALVKAMLINGARNVAGQYIPSEAGVIPNNAEGFGRVDMMATIGPRPAGESVTVKDEGTALDSADEEVTAVNIGLATTLLKVTLVWTDPSGEALQNDLDLILRAGSGEERHGNVPASSTGFDRLNNVEQVLWASPPAGSLDIIVRAHRITEHPQSYALVIRTA